MPVLFLQEISPFFDRLMQYTAVAIQTFGNAQRIGRTSINATATTAATIGVYAHHIQVLYLSAKYL